MGKRFFYVRLFGAQILAFALSVFLNQTVFLKGTPIVRADASTQLAHLPQTFFNSVQNTSIRRGSLGRSAITANRVNPTVAIIIPINTPNPKLSQTPTLESTQTPIPSPRPTVYRPTNPPFQPTSTPTARPTVASSTGSNTPFEQQTIDIVNQRRRDLGLSTLVPNGQLTSAARRHSTDLNNTKQCGHSGSDGSDPSSRVRDSGYTGMTAIGETVGCNVPNPQALVDGWWASPPHHAILINPGMRFIGMGWVGSYQTAVLVQ